MDNTQNINGYNSVYMAIGFYQTDDSNPQYAVEDKKDSDFLSSLSNASKKKGETDETSDLLKKTASKMTNEKVDLNNTFLSYTRIVTAKVPAGMTEALNSGSTKSPFDLSGDTNELQITIKVSGGSRIYTATGTDKDGNSFSKDIDPYNVDPQNTDYAGFATLCEYIRNTEGMADNAMQAVKDAAPSDITQNGNFLMKVSYTSQQTGNLSGAKKLFEQMQSFFEKIMSMSSAASELSPSEDSLINVRSDKSNNTSSAVPAAFKTSLLDELEELIQSMFQKMLDEVIGINNSNNLAKKEDTINKADDNEEEAAIISGSSAKAEEPDVPDSELIEDSLNVENAIAT